MHSTIFNLPSTEISNISTMPSLIITGHPSTGKTSFANLLASRAMAHPSNLITTVVIINETTSRPDKTIYECYKNSTEEKLTRSALKSEFDKYVKANESSKLVILDSMNYIKGFRYELHCISKAAGQKHGVIWLLCKEVVAKEWNERRKKVEENDYDRDMKIQKDGHTHKYHSADMMSELMSRYEPPDQRNRWDRPLYRVDVHSTLEDSFLEEILKGVQLIKTTKNTNDGSSEDNGTGCVAEEILNRSVYNMHSLSNAIRDTSQSNALTSHKMVTSFRRNAKKSGSSGFKRAAKGVARNDLDSSLSEDKVKKSVGTKVVESAEDTKSSRQKDAGGTGESSTVPSMKRQVEKIEDLIDPILNSLLLDVEPLKEGLSTRLHIGANSNVLHDVDSISQETMSEFNKAQRSLASLGSIGHGGTIVVKVGKGTTGGGAGEVRSMKLNRTVQLAELKQFRRQYIKYVSVHPPQDTSEVGIAKSFLSYIENQL
uniref:Protein KTI12 n=1 Tax=Chaetoceros debilis TaxID=122233 RepID=A0A7S3QIW7_9STRA